MNEAAVGGGIAATFSSADAKRWGLAGGHRLERFSLDEKGGVFARLTSGVSLSQESARWEEQGLYVALPLPFAQKMNGKKVEVGIVARSPGSNGSDEVSIVYATQQTGNSGWRTLKLAPHFELKTFRWTIPAVAEGYSASPILVVNADPSGSGKAVELLGVYVKAVD